MKLKFWIAVFVSIIVSAPVFAEEMSWLDAAERLQQERGIATICARTMKQHLPKNDKPAYNKAELMYELARAEMNAVIARLDAALIIDDEEAGLATLKGRLDSARSLREAFCERALALRPDTSGQKGIEEAVANVVGKLIDAGLEIWKGIRSKDDIRRENLRTALKDAKWPAFADIS